ncbi:MAG: AbrB/MazE/SpoVT family DNA-binding domain-containing protein [Deltaproteobacteria bacterium]|nr:AbrB/MazE/SpoVT family DNA-binding domain-containing protein [Deltaproteobacteria bacterium]
METTSVSVKGQVVLPYKIRKALGIRQNTKLIVLQDGNNILLKPIEEPSIDEFKRLIALGDKITLESGLKRNDIEKAVKEARKKQNCA